MALPKLLFYTHGLIDGGAERLWSCLASAFKQRGYGVTFAVDFMASDNAANLDPSIPVTVLGRNHGLATLRLAKLLRAERPDVALSAVGGSNLKLMTALSMSRAATRSIITFHGSVEPSSGLLAYLSYRGLPILSRRAGRTVAVSEGLGAELVAKWHADPVRTSVILNPVYFPASAPVPDGQALAARPDVVLAAGRLSPEKDFTTLIRAFALLNRPGAKLVILGKGPDRARLESEVNRLGLQDAVSMPGYCAEPWAHYQLAKCLVSSSTSELFGNTIVEAMAYGLPVVATACTGPKEILIEPAHGHLVAIGNAPALAEAINAALDSPGDPRPRRERANQFSFDARVPAYEALITDVMAGQGPQPGLLSQVWKNSALTFAVSNGSHELDILTRL